jgi:hypothetical protein
MKLRMALSRLSFCFSARRVSVRSGVQVLRRSQPKTRVQSETGTNSIIDFYKSKMGVTIVYRFHWLLFFNCVHMYEALLYRLQIAQRPIFNISSGGELWPLGVKLSPTGEDPVCPSILLNTREWVNEGVNISPRGHSSHWGANVSC